MKHIICVLFYLNFSFSQISAYSNTVELMREHKEIAPNTRSVSGEMPPHAKLWTMRSLNTYHIKTKHSTSEDNNVEIKKKGRTKIFKRQPVDDDNDKTKIYVDKTDKGGKYYRFDRDLEIQRFLSFIMSPQRLASVIKLYGPESDKPPPLVNTVEGTVKGKWVSKYGLVYHSFEGVPYASPPERFQAPKPLKPWKGVMDTMQEIGPCPQIHLNYGYYYGIEDCLYLNIHTPSINATKLPVLVVIHGGGFNLLSGSREVYGPERFIEQGVIFISINYRLGALGFLCTQTKAAPGNAGMKDMVAALAWIQRNIQKFGGDPSKVTLFGSSSGATAVEYLTISKMSRGLFSQFIMQSGSVLNYMFYNKDPVKYAVRLGSYLHYHTSDIHKLTTFLRNVSAEELIEASQRLGEDMYPLGVSRPFTLSVENPLLGEEMFLHDHPKDILLSGDFRKIPSMIGFNTMEGSEFIKGMIKDPDFIDRLDNTFEYLLPNDLMSAMDRPQNTKALIDKVRKFYFDGGRISNATAKNYVDMIGDNILLNGLFESINIRMQHNDGPIYFWQLAYEGGLGIFRKYLSTSVPGVPHADETGYMFRVEYLDGYPISDETEEVAQRIVTMASNFIKYGNPTPTPTKLLPVTWTPLKANQHLDYLEITETMKMKQDPYPYMDRMAFWKDLFANKHNLV